MSNNTPLDGSIPDKLEGLEFNPRPVLSEIQVEKSSKCDCASKHHTEHISSRIEGRITRRPAVELFDCCCHCIRRTINH